MVHDSTDVYSIRGCPVRHCSLETQHLSYISYHIIFIPWIHTGLQNPYGYGNRHIYLRNLEVKSIVNLEKYLHHQA